MVYYYSGSVRKRFVTQTELKIRREQKAKRLETLKNILLITILAACYIGGAWIDGGPRYDNLHAIHRIKQ